MKKHDYNEFGAFAKKELGPEGRQMWKWDKVMFMSMSSVSVLGSP